MAQSASTQVFSIFDLYFSVLSKKKLYPFVVCFSLCLSLLLVFFLYSRQVYTIDSFAHRAIGGSVVEFHDSSKRSEVLYFLLMVFGAAFSFFFFGLTGLANVLTKKNLLLKTEMERTTIYFCSLLSFPCLIMTILGQNYFPNLKILGGIALIGMLFITSKIILSFFQAKTTLHVLCRYRLILIIFLLYSCWYYALAMLLGRTGTTLAGSHNYILIAAAVITCRLDAKGSGKRAGKLARAALPFLLLPLLFPLSCEIQYWLSKFQILPLWAVYAAAGLILVTISILLLKRKNTGFSLRISIELFAFPLLLATLVVFAHWKGDFSISLRDLLHPGNYLVPAHQTVLFGSLPFVDFWPDLGLQAALPSTVYGLLFGMQGVDALVYVFLPRLIGAVALYFFLIRFLPAQWVLMVVTMLPFAISTEWISASLMHDYPDRVSFAILVILAVGWTMRDFSFQRQVLMWLVALLSFVWMPSIGKAAVQSVFMVFVLRSIDHPIGHMKRVLLSFFLVFLSAFLLYCLVLTFRGMNPLDVLQLVSASNIAEKHILSRPFLFRGESTGLAVWYYGITPVLLLTTVAIFFYRQIRLRPISAEQWMLCALALFSLFAGVRALHRHSLHEGYYPIFVVILIVLLPFLFAFRRRNIVSWGAIVFCSFALIFPGPSRIDRALQFVPVEWDAPRPVRVTINDPLDIGTLVEFLGHHLRDDQSYLEFVHGHLLYTLSGHSQPPFHRIARVLASEPAQKAYLNQALDYYKQGKIPFAIIDGRYWGSHIDGVESAMAAFRISEFVYDYYEPFAEVSGFRIMKAKNSNISFIPTSEKILASIPFNPGRRYVCSDLQYIVEDNTLFLRTDGPDPHIVNMMAAVDNIIVFESDKNLFLRYRLLTDTSGKMETFYSFSGKWNSRDTSATVMLEAGPEMKEYFVPVVDGKNAIGLEDVKVVFPTNANILVTEMDVVDSGTQRKISTLRQNFDMKKLAYVWGMFDIKKRWQSGGLLFENLESKPLFSDEKSYLPVPVTLDKSRGNYLYFRILSAKQGKVTLTYGAGQPSSISFDLLASKEPLDYVLRISSQWKWKNEEIKEIALSSTHRALLTGYSVWGGD